MFIFSTNDQQLWGGIRQTSAGAKLVQGNNQAAVYLAAPNGDVTATVKSDPANPTDPAFQILTVATVRGSQDFQAKDNGNGTWNLYNTTSNQWAQGVSAIT